MTQMYGKFTLFLALFVFLLSPLGAQAVEPLPVLLKARDEAQKEAWQNSLTAAFGDLELIWVEDEKEADIVVTNTSVMDGELIEIHVRQNALLRLSPILEPGPELPLQPDEAIGEYAVGLWQLAQGDCQGLEAEAALSPILAIHRINCQIIAVHQANETAPAETLQSLARAFYGKERFQAARVNRLWLWHKAGETKKALGHLNREILIARSDEEKAFWYGKRAQFYALNFDFQAALEALDMAVTLDSESPLYPTRKGEVYLLLYEWNNAKDAFDAAIGLDPEFAPAYFQRGILLSTMTDIEGANADFSMYLALEPRGVYAELARQYGGEG